MKFVSPKPRSGGAFPFSVTGFYAGIGSRQTPDDVLHLMYDIARHLSTDGWILRSGHAPGADCWFERGAVGRSEIFLPWRSFNSEEAFGMNSEVFYEPIPAAYELAASFHPVWERLGRGARAMHARNAHQILGPSLNDPVEFVVCWTPGGRMKGGTAQALRMANHYDIPITNLGVQMILDEVREWIRSL